MHHDKLRVLILGGGPSAEHDISLKSAQNIFENLHPDRYEPILATITKDGMWLIPSFLPMEAHDAVPLLRGIADIVFIALHGEYGEDGTLQSLFDRHHVRYTGSGVQASILGMHKTIARDCFRIGGLVVPRGFSFAYDVYERASGEIISAIANEFVFPVVVKPADRGSSIGVNVVHALSYLEPSIHQVFHYSPYVLTEEFVHGTELSCGVLETSRKRIMPLVPTEIIPKKNSFFDYDSKYSDDGALEITPARLPKSILRRVQDVAVSAHKILGCRGYSRTDMIWDSKSDKLNVLEINTLPGLTNTSILPKQAMAAGIRFSELLDLIISAA